MHKKNYKAIAGIIKGVRVKQTKDYLIREFARLFAEDNPLFNTTKFEDACYEVKDA